MTCWLAGPLVGSASADALGPPVKIGVSLSLTGPLSLDGEALKAGYELWQQNVNASGGLLGHRVELEILSDSSSAARAAANYQRLISVDHVALTFGPYSTLLTLPSARMARRYGYALIEGAGGAPPVFSARLRNVFDVTLPVSDDLAPFVTWLTSLSAPERPTTIAYATSNNPFTEPVVKNAEAQVAKAGGIKSVYRHVFSSKKFDVTSIADAVAASKAQVVVLGSVNVATVAAFVSEFVKDNYDPEAFIATSGPDQGANFISAVGQDDADGVMVPVSWFGGAKNAQSQRMVEQYLVGFGGTAGEVNPAVAEAYAVGQVAAQAVKATGGFDNAKIITYLHSGVTLQSVEGPVKFTPVGENLSQTAFTFQWQGANFLEVNPVGDGGAYPVQFPKPAWGS